MRSWITVVGPMLLHAASERPRSAAASVLAGADIARSVRAGRARREVGYCSLPPERDKPGVVPGLRGVAARRGSAAIGTPLPVAIVVAPPVIVVAIVAPVVIVVVVRLAPACVLFVVAPGVPVAL